MTAGLRPRAAYLHVAKCAGTSVTQALTAAAGGPPQPVENFDDCYTSAPIEYGQRSDAARRLILDPREVDPARPPGTHVFETHWSLPTLRIWFDAADIATVLREPTMRLLSYVLFAHSLTQARRRVWYPDDLGARMMRRSLDELLCWEPAARAIDNVATRQVMWADERVVSDRFLEPDSLDGLANDGIDTLESLGFVGVLEAPDHAIAGLGNWLGRTLDVGHANPTPDEAAIGLITASSDLDEVHRLLFERTSADRALWANRAQVCGVDPDDPRFERAVGERLLRLSSASSFFIRSGDVDGLDRPDVDAEVESTRVLVVGDAIGARSFIASGVDRIDSTWVHAVGEVPGDVIAPHRSFAVESISSVDLRALLAGHDFDVALLAADRDHLSATAVQLADAVLPGGSLVLVGALRDGTASANEIDSRFWTPTTNGRFERTTEVAPVASMLDLAVPNPGAAAEPSTDDLRFALVRRAVRLVRSQVGRVRRGAARVVRALFG